MGYNEAAAAMAELVDALAAAQRVGVPDDAWQRVVLSIAATTRTLRAAITTVEEEEQARTAPTANHAVDGVVDGAALFGAPIVDPLEMVVVNAAAIVDDDASDEDADYEDADYEDDEAFAPVELVATATALAADVTDEDIAAALTDAIEALRQTRGITVEVIERGIGEALLRIPGGDLTGVNPGTRVFAGDYPQNVHVAMTIAVGEGQVADPLDPETAVAQAVEGAVEAGTPVAAVHAISMHLERLDGFALSDEDAQAPMALAMQNFAAQFGEHQVERLDAGVTPAHRVARLVPTGDGRLDRRALALGVAQFAGTLPFAGIGRIRVRAEVAE